jgi:3-oxoacyl-(acyl-carrier-protein) synthase
MCGSVRTCPRHASSANAGEHSTDGAILGKGAGNLVIASPEEREIIRLPDAVLLAMHGTADDSFERRNTAFAPLRQPSHGTRTGPDLPMHRD